MGLKCYFNIHRMLGRLVEIDSLNTKIETSARDLGFGLNRRGKNYRGFVQLVDDAALKKNPYWSRLCVVGDPMFYQGFAGEDSDDSYVPRSYRTFGNDETMCSLLSDHLEEGQAHVIVDIEGNPPEFYRVHPRGSAKRFERVDPFGEKLEEKS